MDAHRHGAARVTLVGRAGCHLCDDAREVVAGVAARSGATWVELSVDDDDDLLRRYGEEVPVVLVDGVRHASFHVDAGRLGDALARPARRRRRWLRPGGDDAGTP